MELIRPKAMPGLSFSNPAQQLKIPKESKSVYTEDR
jgi:hypothetical protein